MKPKEFFIVDVFAQRRYEGNQLAVVRAWPGLETKQMQAIARETNFSETTFIMAEEQGPKGWPVRIFTPLSEIPFAGHPTLGTAWVIANHLAGRPDGPITLDLKAGSIPVSFGPQLESGRELWMRQAQPSFGGSYAHDKMAEVLGLATEDVDQSLPIQAVSTGLPFMITPLVSLEAVKRANLNLKAYLALIARCKAEGVYLFCRQAENPENQIHARMFAHDMASLEDPATGSACGCLGVYLVKHRVLGGPSAEVRVEQGFEMGRQSLLLLRAGLKGDEYIIEVGGGVIPVARGEFLD